mmetsp:Transcript_49023/g.140915  ORF Transcript_49023/g.140915 Transcript_49023/m.140915 type:complete len:300 (-) Transcript_49023:59-958(-)
MADAAPQHSAVEVGLLHGCRLHFCRQGLRVVVVVGVTGDVRVRSRVRSAALQPVLRVLRLRPRAANLLRVCASGLQDSERRGARRAAVRPGRVPLARGEACDVEKLGPLGRHGEDRGGHRAGVYPDLVPGHRQGRPRLRHALGPCWSSSWWLDAVRSAQGVLEGRGERPGPAVDAGHGAAILCSFAGANVVVRHRPGGRILQAAARAEAGGHGLDGLWRCADAEHAGPLVLARADRLRQRRREPWRGRPTRRRRQRRSGPRRGEVGCRLPRCRRRLLIRRHGDSGPAVNSGLFFLPGRR